MSEYENHVAGDSHVLGSLSESHMFANTRELIEIMTTIVTRSLNGLVVVRVVKPAAVVAANNAQVLLEGAGDLRIEPSINLPDRTQKSLEFLGLCEHLREEVR